MLKHQYHSLNLVKTWSLPIFFFRETIILQLPLLKTQELMCSVFFTVSDSYKIEMSVFPTPTAMAPLKNYLTSPGVLYVLLVTLALLSGHFPGHRATYSRKVNLTLLAKERQPFPQHWSRQNVKKKKKTSRKICQVHW